MDLKVKGGLSVSHTNLLNIVQGPWLVLSICACLWKHPAVVVIQLVWPDLYVGFSPSENINPFLYLSSPAYTDAVGTVVEAPPSVTMRLMCYAS